MVRSGFLNNGDLGDGIAVGDHGRPGHELAVTVPHLRGVGTEQVLASGCIGDRGTTFVAIDGTIREYRDAAIIIEMKTATIIAEVPGIRLALSQAEQGKNADHQAAEVGQCRLHAVKMVNTGLMLPEEDSERVLNVA